MKISFYLGLTQIDVNKCKLNDKRCHQKRNVPLKQIYQRTED